jgi:hypothetical protein
MAKALIIDDAYGRMALNYYQRFSSEPAGTGGSVFVDDRAVIPNTSLDATLDAILKGGNGPLPRPDIVLVTHGNERGLTMRLFPYHRTDARTDNIKVLMDNTCRKPIRQSGFSLPKPRWTRLASR